MAENNLLLELEGQNALIRRCAVRDMAAVQVTAFCLQETKLESVNEQLVVELFGPKFRSNFSFLPTEGTRGGILIAFSGDHFRLISSRRSGQHPHG
jgi:hypothetical protein